MVDRRATSRWHSSQVTFGPRGRIIATLVVLVPVAYAVFVNVMFIVAAAIWGLFLLPWALRDIWRRVPNREAAAQENARLVPGPILDGESILERPAPQRW
jgi:hypothetical protein